MGRGVFGECLSIAHVNPSYLENSYIHFDKIKGDLQLHLYNFDEWKSRKENPQKLTQLSSRSHPRHLVGKRTAQKDTIIDITSDSQVNSNFPNRWSPASLTFNNIFLLISIFIYNVNNHK